MEIRPFSAACIPAAWEIWNECLSRDPVNSDNFYRRIIYDANFDPDNYLFAVDRGELAGFVYGVKRRVPDEVSGLQPEQGWIAAMGVRPSLRGRGAGGALLGAIEETLGAQGVTRIDVGPYTPNYFCPGVDKEAYAAGVKFLGDRGYEISGECCSMEMNLRHYQTPPRYLEKKRALQKAGYTFKLYEARDSLSFFAFMAKHFSWWLPDVRAVILAGRAEKTLILAQNGSGETDGFVLRGLDGTAERFGPFGVNPSLQGIGLGSVLFHEMMENMAADRVFYTYFLWTSGRNLDIYGSWGMKVYRSYAMMKKIINR
ncbi:MAG: GNAT family N-acetyltransferase [Treponema sp.]|jgi:GNAT superfamily N-acetyltransferase|nr:GNAT family N-acetyltransferase [Treponema sp.]